MIVVASDHIGFQLKNKIKDFISELGYSCEDYGCNSEERVDYPAYALKACYEVSKRNLKGMLFCGTGVGMTIVANKVPGIRAVNCTDCYTAKMSREHNDTNILALGSRVLVSDHAKMIVKTWLESKYESGRHAARLKMISDIEKGLL